MWRTQGASALQHRVILKRDNRSVLGIGTVNSRMRSTSQKIKGEINGQHMEFEALEKVDGSNFSFSTDGSTVDYYRRNDRLDKDATIAETEENDLLEFLPLGGDLKSVEAEKRFGEYETWKIGIDPGLFVRSRTYLYGAYQSDETPRVLRSAPNL